MSVGILKRLLAISNLVAVLAIGATAYGFVSHRSEMKGVWQPPDFVVPPAIVRKDAGRIENTTVPLGLFPEPKAVEDTGPATEPEVKLEAEIDKLGKIWSAIVAYPPYMGAKPAIIFQYHTSPDGAEGTMRSIELGQALVMRAHSDPILRALGDLENVRFKFVGCKPDPDNPGWTLFEFDINCDGKNIQTARWSGETKPEVLQGSSGNPDPTSTKIFRDPAELAKQRAAAAARAKAGTNPAPKSDTSKPVTTEPVATGPKPVVTEEVPGSIFVSDGGALATTDEGIEYLRNNYDKVLRDAYTAPYKDKAGNVAGIRVRSIKQKSVATQFGIAEGDVILAVNGRPVTTKTQAVNVVKNELEVKKARFIEVKVLRLGATKMLRFDARDPDTRRKATKAFRNR